MHERDPSASPSDIETNSDIALVILASGFKNHTHQGRAKCHSWEWSSR